MYVVSANWFVSLFDIASVCKFVFVFSQYKKARAYTKKILGCLPFTLNHPVGKFPVNGNEFSIRIEQGSGS